MSHFLRRLCTTTANNRCFIPTSFVHQVRNISISSDNEDLETETDNLDVERKCNPNPWSSGYQQQQWSQKPGYHTGQQSLQGIPPPYTTFAHVGELAGPCVVDIYLKEGSYGDPDEFSGGSGFFINEDTILTCAQVVINKNWLKDKTYANSVKHVEVTLQNGDKLNGVVSQSSMKFDLATVTINVADIEKSFYSVAKLGIPHQVRQGDLVCAIGSPCGYMNSLTSGVISNVDRMRSELGYGFNGEGDLHDSVLDHLGSELIVDVDEKDKRFLQTDCAINKGNSGGPLVNTNGEVIGVVAMVENKDYEGTRIRGVAFVIPIDTVIDIGILEGNNPMVTPSNGSESVASQMEALDVCGVASNPETALADLGKRIRALRKKIDFAETQQQKTGPGNLKPDEELSKWRQELKVLEDEEDELVAQLSWDV